MLARALTVVSLGWKPHGEQVAPSSHPGTPERGRGCYLVLQTLMFLKYRNRRLTLYEEGKQQAKESLEICEAQTTQWGKHNLSKPSPGCCTLTTSSTLQKEPHLERSDSSRTSGNNLGSVGVTVSSVLYVIPRTREEAVTHFEVALGIASSNYRTRLFCNDHALAKLFFDKERFDEAHIHIERAESHAVDGTFRLGRGMQLQAAF
jgi:hypothetical protein